MIIMSIFLKLSEHVTALKKPVLRTRLSNFGKRFALQDIEKEET